MKKIFITLLLILTTQLFSQSYFWGGANYMSNAGYGIEVGASGEKFGGYLATTLFSKSTPLVDGESGGSASLGYRWTSSTYQEESQVTLGFIYNTKIKLSCLLGFGVAIYNDVTMESERTYYYNYDLGTSTYNDTKFYPLLEGKIRYNIDFFYVQVGASNRGAQLGLGLNLNFE